MGKCVFSKLRAALVLALLSLSTSIYADPIRTPFSAPVAPGPVLVAQAGMPDDDAAPVQTYDPPYYPPYEQPKLSTRNVFLSAFLPIIAQGLGSTLVTWFGEKFFSTSGKIGSDGDEDGDAGRSDKAAQSKQAKLNRNTREEDMLSVAAKKKGGRGLHAGIAYETYVRTSDSWQRVDPAAYTFSTGQRILVAYRPNVPGVIDVFNVNPSGAETSIDSMEVSAGQLAKLGPYEFVGEKGEEALKLVLSPCKPNARPLVSRDIVKVQDASDMPIKLSGCRSTAKPTMQLATRDIRKVSVEDGVAFALDEVRDEELETGEFEARVVTISLRHK